MGIEQDMDALAERTMQLAIVAQALDMRSEEAVRSVEHAAQEVSAAAAHLAGVGERIAREATQAIAQEAGAQARACVAEAFAEARAMLEAHARRVHELDLAVQASYGSLARAHRRWLALAPAVLILGCVLAVGGTAAWLARARADLAALRAETSTLEAVASADVVRCGSSLCARLEPGRGTRDGYRRIARRAADR
ncbi:hypothetical protein [Lysobacter sp. N42]|jgi:hypothetical protein|uniref:hypothetical protein n=1 Tax=Lysobacter sp. N42 TaxID=2545719 RepID=UPI0010515866|nr:hypothetical protein [Lysobacter sp. N42]TCZ84651.1 hypothetical protein EYQ95_19900 [Lysobacter sp. N42]